MNDCLVLSIGTNKSIVFNGLQVKITDSNPVALTTFPIWIVLTNTMNLPATH